MILQPHHPLDTINHVLLDKVRTVNVKTSFIMNIWPAFQGSGSCDAR